MEQLGRIVRLQVQHAPLKRGRRPDRWYDADRIRRVDALTVTEHGVVGHVTGEADGIVDAHHRDHPESRHRGDNGLSILTTGHYARLREQFGDHVTDGIAGENVLFERAGWLDVADLDNGILVTPSRAGADGRGDRLVLTGARPAEPCVEFSRLVAGTGVPMQEPLRQLRGGARGYLLRVERGAGSVLREGDRVLVA